MFNSFLFFIFQLFSKFNSFILSVLIIPLSVAIYSVFPIDTHSLNVEIGYLFSRVYDTISFFSIIIRQLTCISPWVFQALLTFFMGKFSILLFKVSIKFILAVLRIFHINLPYKQEDNEE